jgi:hypothetical protein
MRCDLCGEVFKANAPAGVCNEKYDETARERAEEQRYEGKLERIACL